MNGRIIDHIKSFLLFIPFLWLHFEAHTQQHHHRDSIVVMERMQTFLNAFNTFNWKTFNACFADDATVFHPFWKYASRRNGKQEVEAAWREIFPEFTDTTNSKRMNLSPKDVLLQLYGETAIVTFHLGDGVTTLSRRTFVWVKRYGEWKLVHLHASNLKSQ